MHLFDIAKLEGLRVRRICVAVMLSLLAASCHQYPDSSPGNEDEDVEFRVSFNDRSNVRSPLKMGQSLVGVVVPPKAMRVNTVGVQIANSGGHAEGMVQLKICQSRLCATGETQLSGSQDNDYLWFQMKPSIAVNYDEGPITYEITRKSGLIEMSVWTYPAADKVAHVQLGNEKQPITANLILVEH